MAAGTPSVAETLSGGGEPVAGLTCRGCGDPGPRRMVDLGAQPASDDFPEVGAPGPDQRWQLELWFCPRCALVQLGPVQPLLEEPVRAIESRTSIEHAREVVATLMRERPELLGRTVGEFASHHGGSWLNALTERGCRIAADGVPADLVVDNHALAHEPEVGRALSRLADAVAPDGLLVLEHHHLLPLVVDGQFDTVRHGHWSYLSLTALHRLAPAHGLEVVQAVGEPVFGGSLRVSLAHRAAGRPVDPGVAALLSEEEAAGLHDGTGLQRLAARARDSARELRDFLLHQRSAGRRVLGYGAPSKAAVLLGLSGIGPDLLEFTVDASAAKHGLAIPGGRVPIRPVSQLRAARPDVVLVLTWDIVDEVVGQLEADGGWGAEYWLPVPAPHRFAPAVVREEPE